MNPNTEPKTTPEIETELTAEESPAKQPAKKPRKQKVGDGRRFRFGALSTGITVAVVVAAVLLNVLVGALETRFPLTLDLTDSKVLSLSDEARDFAKTVTSPVSVTVCYDEAYFASPNTGNSELNNLLSQTYSLLQQFGSLSEQKITYKFIDLTADVVESAALSQYDVKDGDFLFVSGKNHTVLTLADLYEYDDNYSTYLNYQSYGMSYAGDYSFTSLVEPKFVQSIQKVLNENLPPVTLLTGHNEDEDVVTSLTNILKGNGYEVLTLDITTMESFDDATNVAVLPAPTTDYTADELKKLREWVQNDAAYGRQLVYVADYTSWLPNLSEYFKENYGSEVTPNWVVETSQSRLFTYYQQFIYGDLAETEYTEAATLAVKSPLTLQLISHWDSDKEAASYVLPVVTFPDSAKLIDLEKYMAYVDAAEAAETDDEKEAATALVPEEVAADTYPIAGMAYSVTLKGDATSCALVCGSSGMLSTYASESQNKQTFLNVFNGIVGNENAVAIEGKAFSVSTVDFGSEAFKKGIGLGVLTIGIPLALLIVCLVVFLRRRHL